MRVLDEAGPVAVGARRLLDPGQRQHRASVNSRQTRSGVQNSARPVTACRPHGPPTASLACAATGSVQVGTTRSGRGGAAARPARGAARTRPAGADAPGRVCGSGSRASVCRAGSAAAGAAGRRRAVAGTAGRPAPVGVRVVAVAVRGRRSGTPSPSASTGCGVGTSGRRRPGRGRRDAVAVGVDGLAGGGGVGRRRRRTSGPRVVGGSRSSAPGTPSPVSPLISGVVGQVLLRRAREDGVHELLPDRPGQARAVDDPRRRR